MKSIRMKRESILHAQNVFFTTPINIFLNRETERYLIGYEPKEYRVHFLLYKIDKRLISKVHNPVKFNVAVDVNIREDFRRSIKMTDQSQDELMKNLIIRIIPTRYAELEPIYVTIFTFKWRKTKMGGYDGLSFKISECPKITNSTTIGDICYKKVGYQVSWGGTHGTHTYLIVSPRKGQFIIAEWIKVSNLSKSGHQHEYINPVTVSL